MSEASSGLYFDLLNLIIALIGLFGGLPHLIKWLQKPNIALIDCKILRFSEGPSPIEDEKGQIVGQQWDPATSMITWRIKNKPRLLIFGGNAPNFFIKYTFWRVDTKTPQNYKWADDKEVWPLLAKSQEHPDSATFDNYYLPYGQYRLTLVFYSNDEVIGSTVRLLIFNEQNRRRWTREHFSRS